MRTSLCPAPEHKKTPRRPLCVMGALASAAAPRGPADGHKRELKSAGTMCSMTHKPHHPLSYPPHPGNQYPRGFALKITFVNSLKCCCCCLLNMDQERRKDGHNRPFGLFFFSSASWLEHPASLQSRKAVYLPNLL